MFKSCATTPRRSYTAPYYDSCAGQLTKSHTQLFAQQSQLCALEFEPADVINLNYSYL